MVLAGEWFALHRDRRPSVAHCPAVGRRGSGFRPRAGVLARSDTGLAWPQAVWEKWQPSGARVKGTRLFPGGRNAWLPGLKVLQCPRASDCTRLSYWHRRRWHLRYRVPPACSDLLPACCSIRSRSTSPFHFLLF